MLQLAPSEGSGSVSPLNHQERIRLSQLERAIEKNLTGFIVAGRSLLEIRESRLYREQFCSFGEYARTRFGLCRSTADQLCRSTQVFETLALTTGAPDSGTPIAETVPEIVLRPLSTLPSPELQAQTWRLAACVSPEGKPTRTIAAKVTRMVAQAVNGMKRQKAPVKEKDVMFVRPIQRLAQCRSFRPDLAVSHVDSSAQATRIITACRTVSERCHQIETHLEAKFA